MYLIDAQQPERKWQGSEAVEEITRLLPAGDLFISLYRAIPGAKSLGDRAYEQIRDHRYEWFGRRS
jgi:predicted DCC family thiol-disulfide oxidoreductase YuxK